MRSVYGSIDKVNSSWRVRWSENGARKSKCFRTKSDAVKFQANMALKQGNIDTSMTFGKYWDIAVYPSMSRLAERTRTDYVNTWNRIYEMIENVKIAECNRRIVQDVIDSQNSAGSQRQAYVLLRKILNLAIADDIITKNPVNRHIKRDKEVNREKVLFDKHSLVKALNLVNGTNIAPIMLFCCCCGMRPEEAYAINKDDIDFKHDGYAFINVNKALLLLNGKRLLKEPKTSTSKRIVALEGPLVDYLIDNKEFVKNYKNVSDYPYPDHIRRKWRRFCEVYMIDYVRIGDMRSVYATLSAEAGCLDSVVSQAMGHSGHSMKERNYQSLTMQAMMMNAKCFSDYIGYEWKEDE